MPRQWPVSTCRGLGYVVQPVSKVPVGEETRNDERSRPNFLVNYFLTQGFAPQGIRSPGLSSQVSGRIRAVEPGAWQSPKDDHGKVKKKILLVDDDSRVRESLRRLLERIGFDVLAAPDGQGALDSLVRTVPDMVLMDIMMPGISGVEALRRIRADPSLQSLPVVLMSGGFDPNEELGEECPPLDGFLAKPFGLPELSYEINRLLGEPTTPSGAS